MIGFDYLTPQVLYPGSQSPAESAHSRSELEVCQEIYDVFIHSMGHSRVSLLESNQAIHQHAQCTH